MKNVTRRNFMILSDFPAVRNFMVEVYEKNWKNCGVGVANDKEEYVCFAGMWWTPENKLVYMEPLCTVPQYRHLGLASAALSEL